MTPRAATMTALAALAVGAAVGLGLGRKMNHPTAKPETPALAQIMTDGSLMLERKPDATVKPKQALPAGAHLERSVSVAVRAKTSGSGQPGEASPAAVTHVDLSLVRMPDQTRQVIASSPDGEIVGGLDVPVEAATVQRVQKWTVTGLVGYDVQRLRPVYGAMASRAAGPFVVQGGFIGQTAFVGLGVRW